MATGNFSIHFHDLQNRKHVVYTDDELTAKTTAEQMSIQFNTAVLYNEKYGTIYKSGEPGR